MTTKEITIEYGAVSTTAMKAEPATEAAQATESAFPYSIAVPVSKYVYPGDEVALRFVIQNSGGEPLAEYFSEYFCDMGLRLENVTVTNTPETENTTAEKQSYVDIHFTVSKFADPGIYQLGMYVTSMKTASGAEVSGKIFNNHESAAIIVQEKDVEPTEPQEKYHVLFPKCSVKQGESAEINVSFLHGSSPKLLKEIKADSANITRMPMPKGGKVLFLGQAAGKNKIVRLVLLIDRGLEGIYSVIQK